MEFPLFAIRHSLFASLRLQSALHTCVDGVERGGAAYIKSVSLLTAEAQIGDGFRNVDLAEQVAVGSVAAHAVLVRIAPSDRAPDTALPVAAHSVGDAGLGYVREHLTVREFSSGQIHVECANMRWIV